MEWTSVKNELPKKEIGFTKCLVVCDRFSPNTVFEAMYSSKLCIFQDLKYDKITPKYWMYMPKPPKQAI